MKKHTSRALARRRTPLTRAKQELANRNLKSVKINWTHPGKAAKRCNPSLRLGIREMLLGRTTPMRIEDL